MQKIFNFFPLTVYKSTLSLSENEKNEMIEEVRLMEKKSKNLDYKSATKAWTGDTLKDLSVCTIIQNLKICSFKLTIVF